MASSFLMYIEDEGGNDDDNFSYLENILYSTRCGLFYHQSQAPQPSMPQSSVLVQ